MKKYLAGSLVLGVMVLGGMLPSKVNAGVLTVAQQNSIITMLQNIGATPQAIAQVQAAFGMMPTSSAGTSSTGTTSTTGTTGGGTSSGTGPCTNNAAFNFTNGNPCSNYVPTTAGGTTTTTNTPSTGGPLYPPTTPNTPSTPSNCISTQTNVAPYVYINGVQVQCVKVCVGQIAWNPYLGPNGGMCPSSPNVITANTGTPSITVTYPNGGEVFTPGTMTGVKWESMNIPSTNTDVDVLLNYYDANGVFVTSSILADNQTNSNGVSVTLPDTLPTGAMWGNHFKVSVSSQGVSDMSDAFFTIE
jgi:hypothetical protein